MRDPAYLIAIILILLLVADYFFNNGNLMGMIGFTVVRTADWIARLFGS